MADPSDASDKTRSTVEKKPAVFADKSGGDKVPRRKKTEPPQNPFRQYEKPTRPKKTSSSPKIEAKTEKPKKLKEGKKKAKWTKEQREQRDKFLKSK